MSMDSTFDNENTSNDSIPEPVAEPVVKQAPEVTGDQSPDSHFDDANIMNLNTPGTKFEKNSPSEKTKKPDPKVLAEVFKQSFEEEKVKSKTSQSQYLYYLIVFVIIIVGLLFIRQLSLQRQIDEIKTNLAVTVVPIQGEGTITPSITQSMKTIKPEEFQEVSGEVDLSVEVESITRIAVKIFDDNGVELGGFIKNDIALVNNKALVNEVIDITKSPSVSVGYLVIYPADDDINSPISKTVSLKFSRSTVAEKINVIGPVKNQLVNNTDLDFVGELKGFKNNKIGVRLVDTEGKVIIESQLQGLSDNTSQDYVKFDQTVEIGTLSGTAETGIVEFYDITDTTKTSLLNIQVRLR